MRRHSVMAVVVIHVPFKIWVFLGCASGFLWSFGFGCCLLRQWSLSSCHWRTPFFDLGLCFRFRPASLPKFCCLVSSPSGHEFVLLFVSWRGGLVV